MHFANQTWTGLKVWRTAKVESLPGLLVQNWLQGGEVIAILILTVLSTPSTSHSKIADLTPKILSSHSTVIFSRLRGLGNTVGMVTVRYVDIDPELFWGRLNKISDDAGAPQFNVPCSFMQSLLCLPHANVDVEQSVNFTKTKTYCTMCISKAGNGCSWRAC